MADRRLEDVLGFEEMSATILIVSQDELQLRYLEIVHALVAPSRVRVFGVTRNQIQAVEQSSLQQLVGNVDDVILEIKIYVDKVTLERYSGATGWTNLFISHFIKEVFECGLCAAENQDVEGTHPRLGQEFHAKVEDIQWELCRVQLLAYDVASFRVLRQTVLVQRCSTSRTRLRC